MRHSAWSFTLAVVMSALVVPQAVAQNERARLSGITSIAVGDGGPAPAISVAAGFQLAPHAGFELEALYIPEQDFDRSDIVRPAIFPAPRVDIDGRTVVFLSSFVTDLQVGRLRPYAIFGGGIANVSRKVTIDYPPGILAGTAMVVSNAGVSVPPVDVRRLPIPRPIIARPSENELAFTAGAGLDVRVWKRLSLAADVRYLRLFETTQRVAGAQNITRIGARVAYWF